jgi:FKBP-type peptidyl-prolyl cis-trans isomerase (trigger factor)
MNNALIDNQQDGTIKLTVTLPKEEIEKTREEVITEYAKTATLPGFRQGKAPTAMVEKNIDNDKLREEILKKLLPTAYAKAIQAHGLKPIVNPKIHIEKIAQDEDWTFQALTCEMPKIELGNYKQGIQKLTNKSKIIIPGKNESEQKKPSSEELMKVLLENTKATIPGILIEQETDRLLSQLLDDIKKLGLNLDQYMASTNRTIDSLRQEYAKRAEEDMKLEFALQKVAETEKITVEPKEIEEAIQKAKDEKERASLEKNSYMLAAILRQQKTLDFLMNL